MQLESSKNNNLEDIYKKISSVVPEIEWKVHAPFIEKINKLKILLNILINSSWLGCAIKGKQIGSHVLIAYST